MIDVYVMMSGVHPAIEKASEVIDVAIKALPDVEAVNIFYLPSHRGDRQQDDAMRDLMMNALSIKDTKAVRIISGYDFLDSASNLLAEHQKRLINESQAELSLFLNVDMDISPNDITPILSLCIEHRFSGLKIDRKVKNQTYPEWAILCAATKDVKDTLPEQGYPYPFCGGITYISSSVENAGFTINDYVDKGD